MALGPSMLPTLNVTHDFVIVDKISHRRGNIRLGDVVVCTSPTEPTRSVCKRVLGMPKDIVCVDPTLPTRTYIRVPDGHIWLMGDNMSNSTDSRTYGAVPLGLVTGKVVCKVWPTFAKVGNTLVEYHPSSH
ncbi:LexA/Signal peptidase [Gonapodya prolifera JEL478]|uniref:LexA/Signal peptidase n=1 Tax=Gonapodya prolifera (strain JEL478) TaxID=1344416 RepID=A0A139AS75_GONPJ|nr:LexA/Signal peptidase [Gonapodya prolifera JEL478]|eukprot:KXS19601.1 LexA/Signal peptidase [Gonapodya prolifera JEL478]